MKSKSPKLFQENSGLKPKKKVYGKLQPDRAKALALLKPIQEKTAQ